MGAHHNTGKVGSLQYGAKVMEVRQWTYKTPLMHDTWTWGHGWASASPGEKSFTVDVKYEDAVECVCGQAVAVNIEDDSGGKMAFNGIISEVQYHVDIDTGEGVAGGEEEAQATEAQATEAQADTKAETEATNPV